jgi:hypothetical protein
VRPLSGQRAALLVAGRLHHPEGVVEIRRANVSRVHGEDIVETWIYEGDRYEIDALSGA